MVAERARRQCSPGLASVPEFSGVCRQMLAELGLARA
ncbi:hypothetical protein A2U01_0082209 [Trifolium medium]|uniref:Uncharacterized protein n=1 Tax=Trifolium medium TaxID=97028 RepID=A0A392TIK0_9FABA|nr:hypothetical protein [Trifolium medium]